MTKYDKLTTVLMSTYTFKTILNISNRQYSRAMRKVTKGINPSTFQSSKAMFKSISKPKNNIGLIAMYLHTGIVAPYEILKNEPNYDIEANKFDFKYYVKQTDIIQSNKPYNNMNTTDLFRRLRNSISHYRFHLLSGTKVVFEDGPDSNTINFKLEIDFSTFSELIDDFNYHCIQNI